MIIIYGGSQADEVNRKEPRLPPASEIPLMNRMRGLLQSLKPSVVMGALASGADILFVRAALLEGILVKVVLPYTVAEFRQVSVEPRGGRWSSHFDRIISTPGVELIEGSQTFDDSAATFNKHNLTLLDMGGALGEVMSERVWILAVRPRPNANSPSVTDDLVERAEERGHLTLDLAPIHNHKSAFVVMPYGRKKDINSGKTIDCDPAFHKIYRPLLEDFDVEWQRADLETDTGIIHSGMLEALANCDIALVDLTTMNFNVAYELGIRHVFADQTTLLINPHIQGSSRVAPPFDISMVRVHSFTRGLEVSDQQAENAIRALRPVIQRGFERQEIDSPARSWFDLRFMERPIKQHLDVSQTASTEINARSRVMQAVNSSDSKKMQHEAKWLESAPELSESLRRGLRIELAVALYSESEYQAAKVLLERAQPDVNDALHRLWLQKIIMVYRRLGEHEADDEKRQVLWHLARGHLSKAESSGYLDSETYGIWGGLIKRELQAQLGAGDPAISESLFREMAQKYKEGFEADPSYYTGLNFLMATRLSDRTRDGRFRGEFNEILTVARFINRLALEANQYDYWALISRAELTLHESLERGSNVDKAVSQYAEAARHGTDDQVQSTLFQLDFLEKYGDPPEVIERLRTIMNETIRGG